MHICKSRGNYTGKKSISLNKEYHNNAKVKKISSIQKQDVWIEKQKYYSQHFMANYSNLVYTYVKNNIFDNQLLQNLFSIWNYARECI